MALLTQTVTIGNEMGLHARPAAQLVHLAGKYQSGLTLHRKDGVTADCRSVLSLLMLAASKGCELEVVADGGDAKEALAEIVSYFQRNFDEN